MEDLTGKQFGSYQIVAPLGAGGMAAVYKAYQPGMERYVALKILPRHYGQDPEFVARFEQEAKILAKLQHPHILPVFDYGQADGYAYIVMPFLQSGTLTGLMRGVPLALAQIRRVIAQVGDALDYAHSQGLIHRDVKPSNILLDERGNCLLTDFGIAKMVESSAHLTATGGFIGTPAYMSPEQGLGQKLDNRSDIYALGIILYEMAVGHAPYKAETPMAIVVKQINDPLPIPGQVNPNLPEAVEQVILKALAKQPEDRYASAADMVRALRAAIPESPDEVISPVAPAVIPDVAAKTIEQEPSPTEAMTVATPQRGQPANFKWLWIAAGVLVVVAAAVIGLATMLRGQPVVAPAAATAAVSIVTPVEASTPTATALPPTVSPTLEVTAASNPTSPELYDDFDDPVFEGKINSAKWIPILDEPCQVSQQARVMVIKNRVLTIDAGCNLTVGLPEYVAFADLGVFEARFQLTSDHNGEYLNQGLTFGTEDSPDGGWYAFCGLNSDETPEALFEVTDWTGDPNQAIEQASPAAYDRWYTIRLEANPETYTLDCYVDNTRLGSVSLAGESAAVSEATFRRTVNAWRAANAVGTTLVDDVRVSPASLTTAPRVNGTDTLYDDFEDSEFDGTWNPELWGTWKSIDNCDIEQEDGILRLSCSQPNGSGLNAQEYSEVPFGEFGFIQGTLRLDDDRQTSNGAAIIKFYTSLDSWAECGLIGSVDSDEVTPFCGLYNDQDTVYEVDGPIADYDTWRLLRIELNPETAAITFLVDGERLAVYNGPEVEALKEAEFTVELQIYFEEGARMTGHFDDVYIGP